MSAEVSNTVGSWEHRKDNWVEAAAEAEIQIAQTQAQIQGAQLALQVAQQNQAQHQEQIDNIQKQIDFLNSKFTSDSLYDWMAGVLSATYFQSYQLAYQMCKQLERCYQFELGIQASSFIQFGYWDSLYKGLLAGETLNHDLRRMQASYLQQNARRYELSRYVSLGQLDPTALQTLLVTGQCDFSLPEPLFDNDYPGHYNRRLTRVSLTVVYPNPGKFDNVKATLTLASNKVRISNDTSAVYVEGSTGSDSRFLYNYAAVPQKIAMGNAQDDPGLFVTAIASNIADQRYVPFENAGAVSTWHLEMQQINNEVDLSTVGDVVLHLYYTALDGGSAFQSVRAGLLPPEPAHRRAQGVQRAKRLPRPGAHDRQSLSARTLAGVPRHSGSARQPDTDAEHQSLEVPALDAWQDDLRQLHHRARRVLGTGKLRGGPGGAAADGCRHHDPGSEWGRAERLHGYNQHPARHRPGDLGLPAAAGERPRLPLPDQERDRRRRAPGELHGELKLGGVPTRATRPSAARPADSPAPDPCLRPGTHRPVRLLRQGHDA